MAVRRPATSQSAPRPDSSAQSAPPGAPSVAGADRPGPRARVWAEWRRPVLVAVAGTVVLRLVTEWVALVGQFGVQFPHLVARVPARLTEVWGHWDAGYYAAIAQYGYAGRHVVAGRTPASAIAFAPLYPWGMKVVHAVTGLGYLSAGELLSAVALCVALAALVRLVELERGEAVAGATALVVLAWPAAFFLLAPYPESLALALGVSAFLAARRGWWTWAGVLAAGAAMTKYYMALYALALVVVVWEQRGDEPLSARWRTHAWRAVRVLGPTVAAIGAWMAYQQVHIGDAFAFERAQSRYWHRRLAAPWTLFSRTVSDLVHWRFLDTSTASAVELFDFVTVVLLAIAAVWVFLRVRRSYGVVLGLSWCVFCFQTYLVSEVREVLVLFPFFVALGSWVAGHPWRERVLVALFVPCAYFLVTRFVQGAFAG